MILESVVIPQLGRHVQEVTYGADADLQPFATNRPVVTGGVTMIPGDYFYADG